MERFIGLDVHAASTTCAVIDAKGKHLRSAVVETNGQALIEFLKLQPGTLRLCMEEGAQSLWLAEILKPHVAQLVVLHLSESRGPKSDERDAFALAERMRMGKLENVVYKETGAFGTLRQLAKTHAMIVQDTVRIQNRIKALFRSRGVSVSGKSIYASDEHEAWVEKLPASAQGAARLLFAEYDAQCGVRAEAEKRLVAESHQHPITRKLETCPGLGPIRVAQLVSIVVTPDRFRTRAQFWSYCGLGIVMRSSSDWVKERCRRLAAQEGDADARAQRQPQPHARERVQGSGDDGRDAAPDERAGRGVQAQARQRHEAEPREGDPRAQDRVDGAVDVEAQGGVRRGEARGEAAVIACLAERPSTVGHESEHRSRSAHRTSRSRRRASIGLLDDERRTITRRCAPVPTDRLCPPESRRKPWHADALIEGWFPHSRENTMASMSDER